MKWILLAMIMMLSFSCKKEVHCYECEVTTTSGVGNSETGRTSVTVEKCMTISDMQKFEKEGSTQTQNGSGWSRVHTLCLRK